MFPLFRRAALAASLFAAFAAPANAAVWSSPFAAYLTGRHAAVVDDLDTATDGLLAALAADPAVPELRQQAFLLAVLDGRQEAARLALSLPDGPIPRLVRADAEVRAGHWDAAEQLYAGLPAAPGFTAILRPLLIAWAQQGQGHTDAALATLQPLMQNPDLRAIFELHAALILDQAHRAPEAGRLYAQAETEYSGLNIRLAQMLASFQARSGHPEAGLAILRRLSRQGGDVSLAGRGLERAMARPVVADAREGVAESYLAIAALLRQQNASDFAGLMLQLALDLRPDLSAARMLLADIQAGRGRNGLALAALQPVPADDSLGAVVALRRGMLLAALGRTQEAEATLVAVARDYPDQPGPFAQLGDFYRVRGRFEDAAVAYDKAIAHLPTPIASDWPLFFARGVSLDRAHRWDRAEADLRHALALSPDQPDVLNYLGYSWVVQNRNLDEARDMIRRAVDLVPNNGAYVDSLGCALLRQGDADGAVTWLLRAVELQPEDPTIGSHLGDAYWAAGRHPDAETEWRRALVLHPEPADRAKIEAKLEHVAKGGDPLTPDLLVQ
ncbi:MAG TPA: tetratricopeptide repeat protein [Acetobacteraceae bacterium]|nr:tetratricopeptide repeat protein [Acetobacteraceae bacterium]